MLISLVFAVGADYILVFTPAHPGAPFTYARILPGGLFATFLLIAALFDPALRAILSWKPLVAVGLFSYSLYLIHYPVIAACYRLTAPWQWPEWQQLLVYQGIVLPVCLALAYAFYLVFERPFLKLAPSKRTAVVV